MAVDFVGPIQSIAGLGQLVGFGAILRDILDRDPVIAVFVDDPHHAAVYFIDLDPGFVSPVAEHAAFPLGAGNAVKAAVLKRTQSLVA